MAPRLAYVTVLLFRGQITLRYVTSHNAAPGRLLCSSITLSLLLHYCHWIYSVSYYWLQLSLLLLLPSLICPVGLITSRTMSGINLEKQCTRVRLYATKAKWFCMKSSENFPPYSRHNMIIEKKAGWGIKLIVTSQRIVKCLVIQLIAMCTHMCTCHKL